MQKVCLKSLQEDAADNINRRQTDAGFLGSLRVNNYHRYNVYNTDHVSIVSICIKLIKDFFIQTKCCIQTKMYMSYSKIKKVNTVFNLITALCTEVFKITGK